MAIFTAESFKQAAVAVLDKFAFHKNQSGEIDSVDRKVVPAAADWVLIEDSADSFSKKKVSIGDLPSSGGGGGGGAWGFITGTIADQADLQVALSGKSDTAHVHTIYDSHISNISNPHGVNQGTVGLGNVDNTADVVKPVSLDQQLALDAKINNTLLGASNGVATLDGTGNVPLGQLGNVPGGGGGVTDHTLLSNIGTNTHTQLDSHLADASVHHTVEGIQDVVGGLLVAGAGVTLNYDDVGNILTITSTGGGGGVTDHTLLSNIGATSHADIDIHIANVSNPHSVDAADVGLGAVDNTPDLGKPISTLTQTALDGKLDTVALTSGQLLTNDGISNVALAVGADNLVLAADSSEPAGLRWVTNAGGGGGGADLNTPNEWTGTQNFNQTALVDAPTIAWNASANQVTSVTLTADRLLGLPTSLVQGAIYTLIIIQDSTGGHSLSYDNVFHFRGGRFPLINNLPNTSTVVRFAYDGINMLSLSVTTGYGIASNYKLEFAAFNGATFNGAGVALERGFTWTSNGMRLFVIGESPGDRIYQFDSTVAYSLAGLNTTNTGFLDISSFENLPETLSLDPTGMILLLAGDQGGDITRIDLATADDITTGTPVASTGVLLLMPNPRGFDIENSGQFILAVDTSVVREYSLSAGWDVSTISPVGSPFNPGYFLDDVIINPNGMSIYLISRTLAAIREYSLAVQWTLGTPTFVREFDFSAQTTIPTACEFNPDGSKLYIMRENAIIYEYDTV